MVILRDTDKNGYLGRLWQQEWLSCNNLAKKGYSVRFWWKKFMLQGSGKKSVVSGESGRNLVILHDSDRKLSSWKILTEWMIILQDTDKIGYYWITLTARMAI